MGCLCRVSFCVVIQVDGMIDGINNKQEQEQHNKNKNIFLLNNSRTVRPSLCPRVLCLSRHKRVRDKLCQSNQKREF